MQNKSHAFDIFVFHLDAFFFIQTNFFTVGVSYDARKNIYFTKLKGYFNCIVK